MVVLYGIYHTHPLMLSVPSGIRHLGAFGILLIILTVLLPLLCGLLLLMDELAWHCAKFINGCLQSDYEVINFVPQHGVHFRRMLFPIGRNSLLCCRHFDVPLSCIGHKTKSFVRACYLGFPGFVLFVGPSVQADFQKLAVCPVFAQIKAQSKCCWTLWPYVGDYVYSMCLVQWIY